MAVNWLRGQDLNQRPSGYEPESILIKCHIIDVLAIYLLLCGMMCGIFSASVFEMLRFVSPRFKRQRNNYLCRSNCEPNVMVACDQLGMVAMKLMAAWSAPTCS